MSRFNILGVAPVSAAGKGMNQLRDTLAGHTDPVRKTVTVELQNSTLSVPAYHVDLKETDLDIPAGALRRISHFGKMAILASQMAIQDAGVHRGSPLHFPDASRLGIVFGLGYGNLLATYEFEETILKYGDTSPSPTIFSRSVVNSLASTVSTLLKVEGPSISLTCLEHTVPAVFSTAEALLTSGMADYVLLGFGDECYPLRDYATALLAHHDSSEIDTRQLDTCTYIAGEGFVALLLGNESAASQSFKVESYEGSAEMISDLVKATEVVILDHNGESNRSTEYQRLRFTSQPRVYSNLYGGMPTGSALDLCVALAFIRYSELSDLIPTSVVCISALEKNHFFAMRVTR